MCTVVVDEIVCRGGRETHNKYRLVLITTEDRKKELKSTYLRGASVFGWKPPFKNPILITDSDNSIVVSINLRKKGWFGLSGRNVGSYSLIISQDCQLSEFHLKASTSSVESPPDLTVTATVTGLGGVSVDQSGGAEVNVVGAVSSIANKGPPPPEGPETASAAPSRAPISKPSLSAAHSTPLVPLLHVSVVDEPAKGSSVPMPDHPDRSVKDSIYANRMPSAIASLPALSRPSANDELLLTAEAAFKTASREQSSVRPRSLSVSNSSIETIAPGVEAAGSMMWSGVSRLDAVVDIINVAADIHPLVKGAWSLLNVAYTLAKQQSDLDIKIEDLVRALDANCEFAKVLAGNELEGVAGSIVASILREVLNGAALIKEYCTVRKSRAAVFKFAGSGTSSQVDACLEALNILRRDLGDHITAEVHRDLNALSATIERDLSTLKAKIDRIDDRMQAQATQQLLGEMQFAPEADRAMRSDDSGCLPGTRGEIIDSIVNWAIEASEDASQSYIPGLHPDSRVLWLCGVAGSGKSSIAISVARALRSMGRLGALYGFEVAQRHKLELYPTNLFSTIARQLASRRPRFETKLVHALQQADHDSRATHSVAEQFKLFLFSLSSSEALYGDVVIIDAFDEAGSPEARRAALHALAPPSNVSLFPSGLRFIVTSRYDPDIAERLESLLNVAEPMVSVLRMDHIQSEHTQRDIKRYVTDALHDVFGLQKARDDEDDVHLAEAAKDSFLWASTACRFIVAKDDRAAYTPAERLKDALETGGALDGLYRTILDQRFASSIIEPSKTLRAILGTLVCSCEPVSVSTICALAGVNTPEEVFDAESYQIIVRNLASLITGTHDPTAPLIPLHTSFIDFLRDPKRSRDYAVAWADMQLQLSSSSFGVMKKFLRFNICGFESSFLRNSDVINLEQRIHDNIPPVLSYACRFWPAHVAAFLSSTSSGILHIPPSLSEFLGDTMMVLEWLEVMSLTDTNLWHCLSPLVSLQLDSSDLADLVAFTTYFAIPLRMSTPHIYLSALAFAPSSSLFESLTRHFPNLVHADTPLDSWPQARHTFAHELSVQCVAFSPDGKYVVSGEHGGWGAGGAISLWDVHSGGMALPRTTTKSPVISVACSPDGKFLATGHTNCEILIWDVHSLTASGDPLLGHTGQVGSVAFSPDDALLASGSFDQTVRFWDVRTGVAVGGPLKRHMFEVTCVAFSPDGVLLASSSVDRTIRLWDTRTLSAVGDPLRGHTAGVSGVAFSPDATLLASCDDVEAIRFWDVQTRSASGEPLLAHVSSIRGVAFSPDGKHLVSCSHDRTLQLWDVRSRSALGDCLTGHTSFVLSAVFSPDGSLLASGSRDRTLRIWDARLLAEREAPRARSTQFSRPRGRAIAYSLPARLVATEGRRGLIRLWDARTMSAAGELWTGLTRMATSIAFSPNGVWLAIGSRDGKIQLWNVSTCSAVGEPLGGPGHRVWTVAISPDGTLIASGSDEGTIRLWDVQSRNLLVELEGHSDSILCFAFSPDGTLLASGSDDRTVRLWDVRACSSVGKPMEGHRSEVRSVVFSLDGTTLASGSSADAEIWIWDVQTQLALREPFAGSANGANSLSFSTDGSLLASCDGFHKDAQIWSVHGPPEAVLLRHQTGVLSVHFHPGVPFLTCNTTWGAVHTWDLWPYVTISTQDANTHNNPPVPQSLPASILSSFPRHPDLRPLSTDCLVELDDGWVVGPKKELILWIPPALRPSLSSVLETERVGGRPLVRLDFSKFVCGSDWTNCYAPSS